MFDAKDAQDAQGYSTQPFPLHWTQFGPLSENGRGSVETWNMDHIVGVWIATKKELSKDT